MLEVQGTFLITTTKSMYFLKRKTKRVIYLQILQHTDQYRTAADLSTTTQNRLSYLGLSHPCTGILPVIKSFQLLGQLNASLPAKC